VSKAVSVGEAEGGEKEEGDVAVAAAATVSPVSRLLLAW